jgi:hypothetical protein
MDGAVGPRAAPELGADTGSVLTGLLGLTATEVQALAQRGITGVPDRPWQRGVESIFGGYECVT